MEIRCRALSFLLGRRVDCRSPGVPQVDVKRLDLLDQQQDRLAGRAQLVTFDVREPRSPATQLIDLVFVQTLAQSPSRAVATVTIDRYELRCS